MDLVTLDKISFICLKKFKPSEADIYQKAAFILVELNVIRELQTITSQMAVVALPSET